MLYKKRKELAVAEAFTAGKIMVVKENFIVRNNSTSTIKTSKELFLGQVTYAWPREITMFPGEKGLMYTSAGLSRYILKFWKDLGDIKVFSTLEEAFGEITRRTGLRVIGLRLC